MMMDEERTALLERGTLLYISSSPDPLFQPTLNKVYYLGLFRPLLLLSPREKFR